MYGPQTYVKLLGRRVKDDIYNSYGVLIIPAATELSRDHLHKLEAHRIWITEYDTYALDQPYESSPFQDDPSQTVYQEHVRVIDEAVDHIKHIFDQIRVSKQVAVAEIRNEIIPIIHESTEHPNLFGLFASLQAKDDYTYRHNIGVGVISTLLGRWLNVKDADLLQLTTAATLHDVGKTKVPLEILNKPGKLTQEEYAVMKRHTIWGYEMIKETVGTTHRQALVALQHHERLDGTGYPFGIRGDKIDFFSRIVSVADVFHAMTSKRSYKDESPFYETLRQMKQNAFGEFDALVIRLFMDKMMQSLVGNEVLLTDGKKGKIVMINPHDPLHPLVHVDERFIDLSKNAALHIDKVLA